ncbi:hypothetical protein R1sor_025519 [Riccia sorocarpa]|uniref:Uncharacterized protein n=1 Tax=Riccia sorocarpa TaxID=122646 RepID=A0ABD3GAE0_9MARC
MNWKVIWNGTSKVDVMMDTKVERQGQEEESLGTSDHANATTALNQRHLFISDMVAETAMLCLDAPKASEALESSTVKRIAPQQVANINRQIQLADVELGAHSCANQEPLKAEQESGEILQEQQRGQIGSELVKGERVSEEILQEQQRGGIEPDRVSGKSIVGSESCVLEGEQSAKKSRGSV